MEWGGRLSPIRMIFNPTDRDPGVKRVFIRMVRPRVPCLSLWMPVRQRARLATRIMHFTRRGVELVRPLSCRDVCLGLAGQTGDHTGRFLVTGYEDWTDDHRPTSGCELFVREHPRSAGVDCCFAKGMRKQSAQTCVTLLNNYERD